MGVVEIILLILIAVIIGLWIGGALRARAAELMPVRITGYCLSGVMANGEEVHEGAVAFRKEDIGKTCRIYSADMTLIGEFVICDTGGKRIRQGKTVDIWRPTKQECYQMTQDGFIEVVDEPQEGEGTNE